jgi:hypothetical protein
VIWRVLARSSVLRLVLASRRHAALLYRRHPGWWPSAPFAFGRKQWVGVRECFVDLFALLSQFRQHLHDVHMLITQPRMRRATQITCKNWPPCHEQSSRKEKGDSLPVASGLSRDQPALSNSVEPVEIGTASRFGRISRTFGFVFPASQMKQLKFS